MTATEIQLKINELRKSIIEYFETNGKEKELETKSLIYSNIAAIDMIFRHWKNEENKFKLKLNQLEFPFNNQKMEI